MEGRVAESHLVAARVADDFRDVCVGMVAAQVVDAARTKVTKNSVR